MLILHISVFLKLISFMLHVVSCHIVLYLYNIYTNSNLKFFITYFICILCKSRLVYRSICVFVHHHHVLYCKYFMRIIWSGFSCFNNSLSCGIMCNTCITCNVYHFDNISHYVLQLSRFIPNTLLKYFNNMYVQLPHYIKCQCLV